MGYWESRKGAFYYRVAMELARAHVPQGQAVLDVGGHDCEYLLSLPQFKKRVSIDLVRFPSLPGLERITGDFMAYEAPHPYDLVVCLQVLEHIKDPKPLCQKLFRVGRRVIISIPYNEQPGVDPSHINHRLTEATLREWSGKDPVEVRHVEGRMICVY